MKRKELLKLYTEEYGTDPRTGKPKKRSRYVGPLYRLDPKEKKEAMPRLWLAFGLGSAAFLTAGLVRTSVVRCAWVLPFYMFTLAALFQLLLGSVTLQRAGERIDELQKQDGVQKLRLTAPVMIVLGVLWTLGTVIWMLLNMKTMMPGDIVFLLCGVAAALAGWIAHRAISGVTVYEMEKRGEDDDEADETDETDEEDE